MTDGGGGGGGGGGASSSHDRVGRLTSGQDNRSSLAADLDGAFLLQLLRNPPQVKPKISAASLPHEILHPHRDPAVAAFGPSYAFPPHSLLPPHRPPAPPAAATADYFQETLHFPPPPMPHPPGFPRDLWAPPGFSPPGANHQNSQFPQTHSLFRGDFGAQTPPSANDLRRNPVLPQRDGAPEDNPPRNSPTIKNLGSRVRGDRSVLNPISGFRKVSNADASLAESSYRQKAHPIQPNNSYSDKGRSGPWENHRHSSFTRSGMVEPGAPLGPGRKPRGSGEWVSLNEMRDGKHNVEKGEDNRREGNSRPSSQREFLGSHGSDGGVHPNSQLSRQLHQSRGASGSTWSLIEGSDIEESLNDLQLEDAEEGHISEVQKQMEEGERSGSASKKGACNEPNMFVEQLEELLRDDLAINKVMGQSNTSRGKDLRSDSFRGQYISSQRSRIRRREMECRRDIEILTPFFLSIYNSLIPANEEKVKQKQLLQSLGKLVSKEWPNAQLHLYGSCANSFGVSNSDIDLCLAIDDFNMSKSEILLKLADILQSDNLQNVQALTHARVPIVKMMDPVTGISCDICINNLLAVVNTKLLRDYAQIDDRLRQLAFIVKHWAKSRGVNETYRGTLSSYAYVLMCIHFLQFRKPAILPCLQEMKATYLVTIDDTEYAYFDQVERLRNFGAQNKESIARLLWAFFHYWAYCHDYINDVISVRTGQIISKQVKDWTRRIGNDRHLICIEDPFETSHDLGRVVDKYSIKILREEFERAADILQYDDTNPSVTLFEPYIPGSAQNGLESDSNHQ